MRRRRAFDDVGDRSVKLVARADLHRTGSFFSACCSVGYNDAIP
jgi:hypothetical protein